nr:hypothetical protein Iba_chr01fCG8070 [Ipomoea batatas]
MNLRMGISRANIQRNVEESEQASNFQTQTTSKCSERPYRCQGAFPSQKAPQLSSALRATPEDRRTRKPSFPTATFHHHRCIPPATRASLTVTEFAGSSPPLDVVHGSRPVSVLRDSSSRTVTVLGVQAATEIASPTQVQKAAKFYSSVFQDLIAERFLNPFLVDTKALCDWVLQGQRENHRLEQTHPLPDREADPLPEIVAKKKGYFNPPPPPDREDNRSSCLPYRSHVVATDREDYCLCRRRSRLHPLISALFPTDLTPSPQTEKTTVSVTAAAISTPSSPPPSLQISRRHPLTTFKLRITGF